MPEFAQTAKNEKSMNKSSVNAKSAAEGEDQN